MKCERKANTKVMSNRSSNSEQVEVHTRFESMLGNKWTEEEKGRLYEAIRKFGKDCHKITKHVGSRPMSSINSKIGSILKGKTPLSEKDSDILAILTRKVQKPVRLSVKVNESKYKHE